MLFYFTSTEDLKPDVIIESWLERQTTADIIRIFLEQYFMKCIDWIEKLKTKILFSTRICLIQSGLQFLNNIKNKEEFCVGLIRGLGSTLAVNDLTKFSSYVSNFSDRRFQHFFYSQFFSGF